MIIHPVIGQLIIFRRRDKYSVDIHVIWSAIPKLLDISTFIYHCVWMLSRLVFIVVVALSSKFMILFMPIQSIFNKHACAGKLQRNDVHAQTQWTLQNVASTLIQMTWNNNNLNLSTELHSVIRNLLEVCTANSSEHSERDILLNGQHCAEIWGTASKCTKIIWNQCTGIDWWYYISIHWK